VTAQARHQAVRLRAVRLAYRRRGADSPHDSAYAVYLAVMVTLVALVPLVRAALISLSGSEGLSILGGSAAADTVAVSAGVILVVLCGVGAVRGPAHYPPFLAQLFGTSDLARYTVLRRPFRISAAGLAGVLAAVALVPVGALILGDATTWTQGVPFVIGAAVFGVLGSVAWAAGQRLGPERAWLLAGSIAVAVAATSLAPALGGATPWGWLGLLYPGSDARLTGALNGAGLWPLAALVVVAGAALVFRRPILGGISAASLVGQAQRWELASTAALTGDPTLALSTFRPLPRVGRAWNAVPSRRSAQPLWWTFVWRDAVGAARTPVRCGAGCLGLLASGALVGWGAVADGPGWLAGTAAALVGFVALGALSDGLRHSAEAFAAPPLYGSSRQALVRNHALLPLAVSVVFLTLGATAATLSAPVAVPPSALAVAAALGLAVVVFRLFDSAKGALSPTLLSPIPTPFGDFSGVVVLLWQVDAALIAATTGGTVGYASVHGGALAGVGVALAAAGIGALASLRRFRQL
jgi:hypothetical protein